ncbi:hypothetical protein [Tardiphaga robiniae]|nr:hypothetical protein [Tardiphaga robiniae]
MSTNKERSRSFSVALMQAGGVRAPIRVSPSPARLGTTLVDVLKG